MSFSRLGLPEYLALVKNLRGMVYIKDGNALLSWVKDRFRYRNLAIPASLKLSVGKPVVAVDYPFDSLLRLKEMALEILKAEPSFLDSLILASCFVTPLLLVGSEAAEEAKKYAISTVDSKTEMNLRDWKLHLRIADYSVLDLYAWSTSHSKRLWEGYDLDRFVDERKKAIQKDKKRYWRLDRGKAKARPFLAYLDLAQNLVEDLDSLLSLPKEEAVLGLAIIPAVFITGENVPK